MAENPYASSRKEKSAATRARVVRSTLKVQADSSAARHWLRDNLRRLYENTAEDPLPDEFARLLERLDCDGRVTRHRF